MRNFFKLLGIIAVVAVIWFSMAACLVESKDKENDGSSTTDDGSGNDGGKDGGGSGLLKPTVTVKNSTGYSIDIYFKPSTEVKSWGFSYAGWWGLEDGKSGEYTLDKSISECSVYDIRASGGNYDFIKYGVTVSNKTTITFTTSDLNNMSSLPKITIQNRTGKNFDSISIRPSGTTDSDWRDYGNVSNNSERSDINILIPPSNYTAFDIQAKSSNPTSTYNKYNFTISNGMTILFTNLDRENSTIEDPVIVIQNNTGYTADVYIRSSGSESWGFALSGWWGISGGESYAVSAPKGSIDIKLNGNNMDFIKTNIQAVDGQTYTFTTADKVTNP